MATANLGRVGFVNKGTYSGATTYKVNDVVTYNNGIYACIKANTGQAPTNTSYWQNWVVDNGVNKTGDETINGIKTFSASPIVPTPTTNTQAANKQYVDNTIKQYVDNTIPNIQTLPIGAILNGYTIFPNCIVAFGGEFNRTDYPKLWAYLQANTLVKTQAQWQAEATANGGICGFFSGGNGTTTFRVPNLDKAFLRPDSRGVGSYQIDAIRNIVGETGFYKAAIIDDDFAITAAPTGVLAATATSNYSTLDSAQHSVLRDRKGLRFDASLVVPTANENRPKNIAVLPLIVAK